MLDNVFKEFSERRATEKENNVASLCSIELELPIIYSSSIFYKMCTCNLKLPAFIYPPRENAWSQQKLKPKIEK